MATKMIERSTYWVETGGGSPNSSGDYRYYWVIYYDTDKTNRLTKFTVKYYLQTHCTSYTDNSLHPAAPAGKSTVYINGSSIGSISTSYTTIDKGASWALKYIGEKTFKIYHNDDGSASFTFRGEGFGKGTATSTYSTANGNFPSIASPTIIGDINTFDIDAGVSIPVTKYVSSYYDVLEILNGSNVFKTIENATNGFATKTSTPISVTFTSAELDDIYTKIPKGENATFTFRLTTYTNSGKTSKVGDSSKTATGNFTIQLPSVYGGICTDAFDSNVNLTGDTTKQTIIKGQSYINIAIPTNMQAVANTRKATIVEYVVDDVHIPYDANGVSKPLSTSNSSKDHVVIYAVDSRGTSSLAYTQKFTKYIDYKSPVMNDKTYKIIRDDSGISRFVTASFDGTWWQGNFGAKENNLRPEVWYRDAADDDWEDIYEFLNGATRGSLDVSLLNTSTEGSFSYNGPIMSAESDKGFNIKLAYDIAILIWDELGGCYVGVTVQYGEPAAAVYKNKMALGGPYDEMLGGTQMWGDIYVNGEQLPSPKNIEYKRHIVSAYLSSDYSPSVTAWTSYRAKIDTANVIGDKLSFNSANNWIVIGDGVSKIQMTGAVFFDGNTPKGQLRAWCQVRGTDGNARFAVPAYQYMSSGTAIIVNVPTFVLDVSPGEVVELIFQTGASGTAKIVARGTSIFVEVIE